MASTRCHPRHSLSRSPCTAGRAIKDLYFGRILPLWLTHQSIWALAIGRFKKLLKSIKNDSRTKNLNEFSPVEARGWTWSLWFQLIIHLDYHDQLFICKYWGFLKKQCFLFGNFSFNFHTLWCFLADRPLNAGKPHRSHCFGIKAFERNGQTNVKIKGSGKSTQECV